MKSWTTPPELLDELREALWHMWESHTDKEIGERFGFSRLYVKDVRIRMGLIKTLAVLRDRKDMIRWEEKKKRALSQNKPRKSHKKMTELERFERQWSKAKLRKERDQGLVEKAPMTHEQHDDFMRSQGYVV